MKKAISLILALVMALGCVQLSAFATGETPTGYSGASLPAGPTDMNSETINVNAANAQYVLDGAYGNINGKTINFTQNVTEVLDLARPTKYQGSGTTGSGSGSEPYSRTLENVTFTASDDVTLAGFYFRPGHIHASNDYSKYNYVEDRAVTSTNDGYYRNSTLTNITFSGLTVTGTDTASPFYFIGSQENATVSGITFTGCTITSSNNSAINCNNNGNLGYGSITVENCVITANQIGVYINGVGSGEITLTNNYIVGDTNNAISIWDDSDAGNEGSVKVTGNYLKSNKYTVNFDKFTSEQITFTGNAVVAGSRGHLGHYKGNAIGNFWAAQGSTPDSNGTMSTTLTAPIADTKADAGENEITYNSSYDTAVVDTSAGTWVTLSNTPEPAPVTYVAQIGETEYATLAEAITAATNGDTIKLLADIELDKDVHVTTTGENIYCVLVDGAYKYQVAAPQLNSLTIDGNGHTIRMASNAQFGSKYRLTDGCAFFFGKYGDNYLSTGTVEGNYTFRNVTFTGFDTEIIRSANATVNLVNCTFTGNHITKGVVLTGNSTNTDGTNMIYAYQGALNVDGCTFTDNMVSDAKYGLIFSNCGNTAATITINNSLFQNNGTAQAPTGGNGLIYLSNAASSTDAITNNTFDGNYVANTSNNAAVVYLSKPVETFSGNLFTGNHVNVPNSTKKEAVLVLGSGAVGTPVTDNAFVNNELDSNASTKRATIVVGCNSDLSNNYWGDGAVAETGLGLDIFVDGEKTITNTNYATAYAANESPNNGCTVTLYSAPALSGWSGSGTQSDPWIIANEADLRLLATRVNEGNTYAGEYFKVVPENEGTTITLTSAWTPIGNGARKQYAGNSSEASLVIAPGFSGNFDGNGKTISGLNNTGYTPEKINGGEYVYGLFGIVDTGANIHDLTLTNVNIDTTRYNTDGVVGDSVGALVGYSAGGLTVSNVSVSGTIIGQDGVGGIVGRCYSRNGASGDKALSLTNCTSDATVTGNAAGDGTKAAGLFGYIADNSTDGHLRITMTGNSFTGTVSGADYTSPIAIFKTEMFHQDGEVYVGNTTDTYANVVTDISDNTAGGAATELKRNAIAGEGSVVYLETVKNYVAQIGDDKYETLAAAVTAATNDQTIELLEEITLDAYVAVNKTITLDLKGHSITRPTNSGNTALLVTGNLTVTDTADNSTAAIVASTFPIYVNGGTLTVNSGIVGSENSVYGIFDNGTTTINGGAIYGVTYGVCAAGDATLTVSGGAIAATGEDSYGIFGQNTSTVNVSGSASISATGWGIAMAGTSTLNVTGGTIRSGSIGISTNGNAGQNATVTISGGEITGTGLGVYQPSGKLTISGGTITGATGVYFKSNSLSITGGTINGNGTKRAYNYNGNGANYTGDALVIDSCGYPNGINDVSVSGGNFNSTNADAVACYTYQQNTPVTNFITGGKYSSEPDSSYVASGYKAASISASPYLYQVGVATITTSEPSTSVAVATAGTTITYTVDTTVKETEESTSATLESKTNLKVEVKGTQDETTSTTDASTAVASLNNIASNDVLSQIVTDAIEAAGASVNSSTKDTEIVIQVAKSAPDTSVEGKVTYEVHPEAVISVVENKGQANEISTKVGTVELANSQITGTFSFKLYALNIAGVVTGDTIQVTHIHSDGTSEVHGRYPVDSEGYITVKDVTSFSDWELEQVDAGATPKADFSYSLSLGDDIDIIFKIKNLTGDLNKWTIAYGSGESQTDAWTKVTLNSTDHNTTLNRFTIASCAAKEMGDETHVIVKYDGDIVKDAYYSVKSYCDTVINGNYGTELTNLCKATLDYGSYAQKEFDYNADNPVNGGSDFFTNSNISVPAYNPTRTNSNSTVTGVSLSLVTTSKTQLSARFTCDTSSVSGVTVNGSAVAHEVVNGKLKVTVSGIAAKELGDKKTIVVTDGSGSYTYQVSPVDYMGLAIGVDSQVALNRSFYNYYLKAAAYFESKK